VIVHFIDALFCFVHTIISGNITIQLLFIQNVALFVYMFVNIGQKQPFHFHLAME